MGQEASSQGESARVPTSSKFQSRPSAKGDLGMQPSPQCHPETTAMNPPSCSSSPAPLVIIIVFLLPLLS